MSNKKTGRPYDITVPPPITSVEIVDDQVVVNLDLPPILPPEGMGNLVRQDLGKRGFEQQPDGTIKRERGGVEVTIDPEDGTMTIRAEGEVHVPPPPPGKPSPCSCRIQQAAQEAERRARETREAAQQEVTERLEGTLGRLGCEMEAMTDRVTKEALKEKARSLGDIVSISEDVEEGTMTIVVEV